MPVSLLFVSLLAGCTESGDSGSSSTTEKAEKATISLASPADGATVAEGEAVHFLVTAKLGKEDAEVNHAEWTAGTWSRTGNDFDATDLPVGDLTVSVEALVDGQTVTDTVTITVEPAGPPQVSYRGTFSATASAQTDFGDVAGPCDGSVSFTATRDTKAIAGSGMCTWRTDFGDADIEFNMDGGWTTGSLAGDLILVYDGTEYRTAYTGTGNYNEKLDATFDTTIETADGSLRLNGSWSANPQ